MDFLSPYIYICVVLFLLLYSYIYTYVTKLFEMLHAHMYIKVKCIILLDINECLTSPCGQTCTNIIGSFTCSCDSGFVLDNNGNSCLGLPLISLYSYVIKIS